MPRFSVTSILTHFFGQLWIWIFNVLLLQWNQSFTIYMKASEAESHKQIPFNIHSIEIETKCVTIRIFFNETYPPIHIQIFVIFSTPSHAKRGNDWFLPFPFIFLPHLYDQSKRRNIFRQKEKKLFYHGGELLKFATMNIIGIHNKRAQVFFF